MNANRIQNKFVMKYNHLWYVINFVKRFSDKNQYGRIISRQNLNECLGNPHLAPTNFVIYLFSIIKQDFLG